MSDTAEESPAQRAARLRREKREKKIISGGSDRLARITNVSGREEDLQPTPPPKPSVASDSGEVDIPHIPASFSSAAPDPPISTPDDLDRIRAALRTQALGPDGNGSDADSNANADPMMQLMQQMLGLPAPDGSGGGFKPPQGMPGPGGPELPPALASLLSGQPMGTAAAQTQPPVGDYLWKIVHAVFAVAMGLYVVLMMPFTGSKEDRLVGGGGGWSEQGQGVFWIFATVELLLQSTRFMLERGQAQTGGMIVTVAGFLPEPYRGYLFLINRYSGIWSTLAQDSMVILFLVGSVAWWKGQSD